MKSTDQPPAIFIMGPTASGKTDLAIALAEQFPVGIISVDSAQIFRELDIGSAKPDIETLAKYPHKLINIREPSEAYSVGEFIRDAKEEMVSITNAGRVPLLVGGTMLYFKKLLEGMAELPPADAEIRKSILKRADDEGWPVLFDELRRHDPQTASKIHPNHSQRIQRALEVLYITGETLSDQQSKSQGNGIVHEYNIAQIALIPQDRRLLHSRIEERFHQMIIDGFVDEVQLLHFKDDLTKDLPAMRSAGYRQLWQYFDGDISLEEAINKGIFATRQLAKRQLTWLRGWSDLNEIYIDHKNKFIDTQNLCDQVLKILEYSSILPSQVGISYLSSERNP